MSWKAVERRGGHTNIGHPCRLGVEQDGTVTIRLNTSLAQTIGAAVGTAYSVWFGEDVHDGWLRIGPPRAGLPKWKMVNNGGKKAPTSTIKLQFRSKPQVGDYLSRCLPAQHEIDGKFLMIRWRPAAARMRDEDAPDNLLEPGGEAPVQLSDRSDSAAQPVAPGYERPANDASAPEMDPAILLTGPEHPDIGADATPAEEAPALVEPASKPAIVVPAEAEPVAADEPPLDPSFDARRAPLPWGWGPRPEPETPRAPPDPEPLSRSRMPEDEGIRAYGHLTPTETNEFVQAAARGETDAGLANMVRKRYSAKQVPGIRRALSTRINIARAYILEAMVQQPAPERRHTPKEVMDAIRELVPEVKLTGHTMRRGEDAPDGRFRIYFDNKLMDAEAALEKAREVIAEMAAQ